MFNMKYSVVTALLAAALLTGCASTEQDRRAGTGALIGAGAGALIGQAIGGNTGATVVGAAAGGIAGAAIGAATTPAGQRNGDLCRYRDQYGRIYRAPCRY
ncbi:glycine zipper 2TM domain-containing protein [Mesorhizobium denitrificans]|uniref:Glycine zipper 2TM domain-containing protein n=2 Tax=Phyllobacteriaceae TaxID=69277 RepID=A0A371X227_9HYPH|nr:glycine zipper 2TM domain-containing protein [Mesorhizobium denitrificans]